jgi:hypothetical protein
MSIFYPIRLGRNQVLFYENNDTKTIFTATIAEGNYDETIFATALNKAIEEVGANTYTVLISSSTKKGNCKQHTKQF